MTLMAMAGVCLLTSDYYIKFLLSQKSYQVILRMCAQPHGVDRSWKFPYISDFQRLQLWICKRHGSRSSVREQSMSYDLAVESKSKEDI